MDHLFAPVTTAAKADYMSMLVEDFLEEFCKLYPDRRLIPKMHYMLHLATWIKTYVAICTYSTNNILIHVMFSDVGHLAEVGACVTKPSTATSSN